MIARDREPGPQGGRPRHRTGAQGVPPAPGGTHRHRASPTHPVLNMAVGSWGHSSPLACAPTAPCAPAGSASSDVRPSPGLCAHAPWLRGFLHVPTPRGSLPVPTVPHGQSRQSPKDRGGGGCRHVAMVPSSGRSNVPQILDFQSGKFLLPLLSLCTPPSQRASLLGAEGILGSSSTIPQGAEALVP